MNFNQIERLYQNINKKEKHIQCVYNPKFTNVKSNDKKHVYMRELKKDRKIDLKAFGQDLFINIANDEEKFLTDLKIYAKTGFKHHFNAFHELVDSPDKIKTLCKSINRVNITEDEFLRLNERRKSVDKKQLEDDKIISKECYVTPQEKLKTIRPLKTVKLSNQQNNKIFARLKSMDREINCFSPPCKLIAQNLEGSKYDTMSQKIDNTLSKINQNNGKVQNLKEKIDCIRNKMSSMKRHVKSFNETENLIDDVSQDLKNKLQMKSTQDEDELKTLHLPCVVFHIPSEKYEYFKPGAIVDIMIEDVSEKTLKSQKIINERVQTNPALSNNSLIINIPLDPCRWIESVKNLENKTLRISVTPKRMNSNKSIVQYFYFGYIDPVDLNKAQPEIVKRLPLLKVFLEHIRYIEFNKANQNNCLDKNIDLKQLKAKISCNSLISKIEKKDSSLKDKANLNLDLNKDLFFNEGIQECSRLKNPKYIDKLINVINDAMEIKQINKGKKNINEKRALFKKSCLSYDDLDSASNLYSNLDIKSIYNEIKMYEEGSHSFKIVS